TAANLALNNTGRTGRPTFAPATGNTLSVNAITDQSGTNAVTLNGAGTLLAAGTSTYGGATTVKTGTLRLGGVTTYAGFGGTGVGYQLNGGGAGSADVLTLTDQNKGESRLAWFNTPVPTNSFNGP